MKKLLGLILITVFLSSCAGNQARDDWNKFVNTNKSMYKNGRISALTYYTRYYNKALQTNFAHPNQEAIYIDFATKMLNAAEDLSDNKISQKQFDRYERNMIADSRSRIKNLDTQLTQNRWDAIGRLGQQLYDMDMQRINNHNSAVESVKGTRTNIYGSNGQYLGYEQTYGGDSKRGNVYGADGSYQGFTQSY